MSGPNKPKGSGLMVALLAVGLLGVPLLFLAIWQFLAPVDRRVPVAYSEFLEEVHAGHVQEIRVHDREIDYRLRPRADAPPGASSGSAIRHTVGPVPDQAFLDSLKPTDPSTQPPKVIFDK